MPRSSEAQGIGARKRFEGKVVLITGATSGIGETTAMAFAREGAKVAFCGRRKERGLEVEKAIIKAGGQAKFFQADVTNEKQMSDFVNGTVSHFGRIDVAFNNAGTGNFDFKPPIELSLNDFENTFKTNVAGVFISMKFQIPVMIKQGGGVILNMASLNGHRSTKYQVAYSASKAAVVSLSATTALAYGKQGIRINSLSPGTVNTETVEKVTKGLASAGVKASAKNALDRYLTEEEVAKTVLSVCSDDGSSIYATDIDLSFGEMALI
ncbi:MAG: SDR family oxidoreductase [Bdellovibrionota bacterium]